MIENSNSLTRDLVRHIRAKAISQHDLDAAALFTLDAVANALAGRRTTPGKKLLALMAKLNCSGDAGRMALLQGGLTHILEMDDLHRASVVHPGCVVVPAAFALAFETGVGGVGFLSAVLQGFEATCRVGMAVGQEHYRIWHSTATCGPFGSAMAAACLLDLGEDACVDALGNAGTQAAGLWQFLDNGAMSKHLHAGRGAEAGVIAAELASLGFSGPPQILEGERGLFAGACPDADPEALLRHPEARWQLHETSIKPWPCCRHTHPAIDAALELSAKIDASLIDSIVVKTYQAALDICDRPAPGSVYEAKFSLQHCVAAALTFGRVDFGVFEQGAREELAECRRRVNLNAGEPYLSAYPKDWGAVVTVRQSDGVEMSALRNHCKGDPDDALSVGEMREKALMLLEFGEVREPEQLIDAILAMSDGGAPPVLPILI
ncbi:MAG: MmgE/PrpD family protein [Rhodospirillales bacterium]|nr:MmgE/PrpD family protein [Rhodospirillales bacterium]